MKKLTLALLAAFTIVAVAPAQEGKKMAPMKVPVTKSMSVMDCCMQGLSADEKKTAMAMMKSESPAEHKVMLKRCSMCMKDPHTALKKMDPSKITDKMAMDHMMSGMTKSEQKTMMAMFKRATPAQAAVGKKMAMNCCMYGMTHAGHKGK